MCLNQYVITDSIRNIAFIGAEKAGYNTSGEEPGDDGSHRWLKESAPRQDVLIDLCNQLGLDTPDVLLRAALQRE